MILTLLVGVVFGTASAQFVKPFDLISKKKTSYVTLEDGTVLEGTIKKLKYSKKGLIKEFSIKIDGKKRKLKMEEVKFAYFPQNALDKLAKAMDFMDDATLWAESSYEAERLKDGYAYFEKIDIILKGEERKLLMQLLNPFPNNRIKVYYDPQAGERGGMRMGGIKVVKSQPSNYYVGKDGEIAKRLRKKDYDDQYEDLFGDCRTVNKKYEKMKWKEFEDAVTEYNSTCIKE